MTVPILVDIRATTAPTNNDIFAATIVRAKISLPKLSVPNQCVADAINSLSNTLICDGVIGKHNVAPYDGYVINIKILSRTEGCSIGILCNCTITDAYDIHI